MDMKTREPRPHLQVDDDITERLLLPGHLILVLALILIKGSKLALRHALQRARVKMWAGVQYCASDTSGSVWSTGCAGLLAQE